jgi:two-component system response regulator FixJ
VSNFLVHLVDDDDAVRQSLARLLALGGYAVEQYASGAALLEAADRLGSGCVLLDLNMPDADGLAINAALKERSIDIPVIIMTGAGDLTSMASQAGIAAVIQKPFRRAELMSLLDKFGIRPDSAAKPS